MTFYLENMPRPTKPMGQLSLGEVELSAEKRAAMLRSGPGVVDFFLRFTEWDPVQEQHVPKGDVIIDRATAQEHVGAIVTAHENGWDPAAFSPPITHAELASARSILEEIAGRADPEDI